MGITARGIVLPEELNFVVIDQCLKSLQSSTFVKRKVESVESYLSKFTTVHLSPKVFVFRTQLVVKSVLKGSEFFHSCMYVLLYIGHRG